MARSEYQSDIAFSMKFSVYNVKGFRKETKYSNNNFTTILSW